MKFKTLVYIILSLIISLASCKSSQHKVTNFKSDSIKKVLDSLVIENEIPGINFSYIDAKNHQHDFSVGYDNLSKRNKLKISNTMFSGSVGKTYAAAIIFQLVDEGIINLDDKILNHLPPYKWLENLPNIKDITVRMLLSHTSGLPRWVMDPEVWNILNKEPDKIWSYKDRLSFTFDKGALGQAGEKWAYSDTNYLLLGFLIETLLNKDYYEVLNERILRPNKLNSTFPSLQRDIERLASGYSKMPNLFQVPYEVVNHEGRYVFNPQFEWTGGGIASTASDLVKWVNLYYNSDLISNRQRNSMYQVNEIGKDVYAEIHSYGMGTFVYTTKYGEAYGHSGFMPGYNAIIAFFPELKISCAIQINCDFASEKMKLVSYLEKCVGAVINE